MTSRDRRGRARRVFVLFGVLSLVMAVGCEKPTPEEVDPVPVPVPVPVPQEPSIQYLEQGWDAERRDEVYYTPQGSRLYPYSWFMALERADSEERFASPENLRRHGWIVEPRDAADPSPRNPDQLPIGFVKDPKSLTGTGEWVGLTCAACHTNDIEINGRTVRIDGAGASVDFDGFLADLDRSLAATDPVGDPGKFERFAQRANAGAAALPPEAFQQLYARVTAEVRLGLEHGAPTNPGGPGRIDALGKIVNAMAVDALGIPENHRVPNAPTSTPFVWISPQLDFVQWDPLASNVIARNAGEVLGVFGALNFGKQPPSVKLAPDELAPFSSSVIYENLEVMEEWLRELQPPRWPDHLVDETVKVDEDEAIRGRAIFETSCQGCHTMPPFRRTKAENNIVDKEFIEIGRVNFKKIGVDERYIQEFLGILPDAGGLDLLKTGPIAQALAAALEIPGSPEALPRPKVFTGGVSLVIATEVKARIARLVQSGVDPAEAADQVKKKFLQLGDFRMDKQGNSYRPPHADDLKAGPLLGIWATAPFLHNGSVPTLDALLRAPEDRPKTFWVGGRALDTQKLGIQTAKAPGRTLFDTAIYGNGNGGHAYPKEPLGDSDRAAVLEFLKDPQRFLPPDPGLSFEMSSEYADSQQP